MLRWKDTPFTDVMKKLRNPIVLSVVFTLLTVVLGGVYKVMMILLLLSTYFTLFVNFEISYKIIRNNFKMSGAYLAHIGLALFILGVIGSAAYSDEKSLELRKGEKVSALGYDFTFTGYQPIEGTKKYAFNVEVKKGGTFINTIKPVMYISDFNSGLMREPDIMVGITRDLYISPQGYDEGTGKSAEGNTLDLKLNEYTIYKNLRINYTEFVKPPDMAAMQSGGDFSMGAKIVLNVNGKSIEDRLLMKKEAGTISFPEVFVREAGVRMKLLSINPTTKIASISIASIESQSTTTPNEVLSITASIKPFVNLVWLGVVVMVLGFFLASLRRAKEFK
jgi:cytochrome c-type biogenesis protein CcmF